MYSFLNKHGQTLAFGIGVAVTVIFFLMILGSDELASVSPTMEEQAKYDSSLFNFGLAASIFLTFAAAIAMLFFGIAHIVRNPKGSLKGIIGLGIVAVLMFLGYSTSTGEADHPTIVTAIQKFEDAQKVDLTPGQLKFIGGSIITALVLLAVSLVSLIVFGVRNLFK